MPASVETLEKLLAEGRFLEARRKSEDHTSQSENTRTLQILALSMAKSGASKAALEVLQPVVKQYPDDPETCGILGSIYKELFKATGNTKYAILSRDTYLTNFLITGHYYTGVNAASMYAVSGSIAKAREIASKVISKLNSSPTDVWEIATLAEAFLLVDQKQKALELYLQCRHLLAKDWGKICSIYNQLWLLNHYIRIPSQVISTFSPPAVAAFVGHMLDHPNRPWSRFPASIESDVKQALAGAIQSVNAKVGYSSLACGGDILFAEAMIETGGEVNLFLPFNKEDFLETSVAFGGDEWVQRFKSLFQNHQVVFVTTEPYQGRNDLFSFQSQVIFGAALRRAEMLHSSAHLITVFSNLDTHRLTGGTEDTLKLWPAGNGRININPQNFIKESDLPRSDHPLAAVQNHDHDEQRCVRFLLMVDLPEAFAASRNRFDYHTRRKIKELNADQFDAWNGSIIFAFKTIEEAVTMAWALARIQDIARELRIALHAGPISSESGKPRITGHEVEALKKINDLTAPGKIFSSFQFASILALHGNTFAVEFAGNIQLANSEILSIFHLNRHADAFDV